MDFNIIDITNKFEHMLKEGLLTVEKDIDDINDKMHKHNLEYMEFKTKADIKVALIDKLFDDLKTVQTSVSELNKKMVEYNTKMTIYISIFSIIATTAGGLCAYSLDKIIMISNLLGRAGIILISK
jgi:chlorite dismutase